MKRLLAFGSGLLVVVPRRIIAPAERIAFENPEDGRRRRSTVPIARLKGLAFVWVLARGAVRDSDRRAALGLLGVVLALVPRSALESGLAVAYENPDELEVKPWVIPATRLLGACYLVAGFAAGRAETPRGEPPESRQ
ncbi:hypothetical protein [Halopiger djelfimassiliensis]|uniref:hypothetical protein n=1 Tax=Halopiger djelfimassiliensis TaxID=1293047 RepID=UPI000677B801|nr:hypothetical protein [Halopiger djelfimassiliensis]